MPQRSSRSRSRAQTCTSLGRTHRRTPLSTREQPDIDGRVESSLIARCKSKHCMPHSPIVLPDTNTFRAVMVTLQILPPPVATMSVATPCKNPPPKRTARLRTAVTPSASTLQFTTSPPTVVPKPWRTHATKDFQNKAWERYSSAALRWQLDYLQTTLKMGRMCAHKRAAHLIHAAGVAPLCPIKKKRQHTYTSW